jgi:hypothetical protein
LITFTFITLITLSIPPPLLYAAVPSYNYVITVIIIITINVSIAYVSKSNIVFLNLAYLNMICKQQNFFFLYLVFSSFNKQTQNGADAAGPRSTL